MRKLLKLLGIIVLVIAIALVVMGFRGRSIVEATYGSTFRLIDTLPDSIDLAEADRWTILTGCRDCHGEDLSGEVMIDAPPFLVVAPNLTRGTGGVAADYETAADWDRAIRYRIRPDGTGMLPMMPSENYHHLSDADLMRIIAAVRAAPPVDRELPSTRVRLMGLPIAGIGVLHPSDDQPDAPAGPTPPAAPTADYGAYLARLTCVECHGEDLRGGPTPGGGPKATDLAAAGLWSYEAFAEAVTRGVAPGGRRLAEQMPSPSFSVLTETELRALQAYLATLLTEER
ncbi:MAG: c-type cytochrome [Gemmatimonadota bacterium]|nr:c-type cytochrome [Gemmatimonadota bacterium]